MIPSAGLTKTIVTTVAAYENASPDELPPLADTLEAETFQQLSAPESELTEPLSFEYLWYDVTVLPGGDIEVTP